MRKTYMLLTLAIIGGLCAGLGAAPSKAPLPWVIADQLSVKGTSDLNGAVNLGDGTGDPIVITGDVEATSAATDGIQLFTGNLRVGNGTPGTNAMNGEDAYIEGQLEVDAAAQFDGAAVFSSTVVGGLAAITGDADGKTLTAAESGTVQTNAAAVGGGVWNLPDAAAGLRYTFVVAAAQNLDVNAATGDQILGLTNATGDAIRNATAGSAVTLMAIDATNWVPVGTAYGTWSDAN